ncbi:MAG TPA: DUF5060 domain-containing protein [Planctomycetota bacterium]|nr:DUF5060 domain-containing protein [Planctomycetota bacterium]
MNHSVGAVLAFAIATSLALLAAERQVSIEAGAKQVKRLAKIEFTITTNVAAENPYDAAEIDVSLELTAPSGKKLVYPAFWFQPVEREQRQHSGRQTEWLYPSGAPGWRARFTPTEVGNWSAVAAVTTREGTVRSGPVAFECMPAEGKGFVRVSARDPRFLEFTDGSPFFPVGQNVAFITDTYKQGEMLQRLGENGANYVRIWCCCCDWAMGIEARKSGWARSWAWFPPILAMPDQDGYNSDDRCVGASGEADTTLAFQPTRPLAVKPNTKYRLTGKLRTNTGVGILLDLGGGSKDPIVLKGGKGWTPFQHDFTTRDSQWWLDRLAFRSIAKCTMYLRDLSLREVAGSAELLWEADANRPLLGWYNQLDCRMLDALVETAEQSGLYLQLTMFTRDHYMKLLRRPSSRQYDTALEHGRNLVRYFVARWGYSAHVAAWEYSNEQDPGLPTERFYTELGELFEKLDPARRIRCNSTWHAPSRDYRHPKLDTADMHWYMRPPEKELFKDAVAGVLSRVKAAREAAPSKPVLFTEFGLADDKFMRAPEYDKDTDYTHLHNALWASALSGMSSTVMSWWWDDVHKKNQYHHYKPVSAFVADIPYTTARLRAATATVDKGLRLVGLQGDACAYVWLSDPQSTWWKIHNEGAKPAEIRGATLTLQGLAPGNYQVEWWNTWDGKPLGTGKVAARDALTLQIPAFSRDIAVKITR